MSGKVTRSCWAWVATDGRNIYDLEMLKRPLLLLMSALLLVLPLESAQAAKQIAFTWSTSFALVYPPGSGLKAGVNPSKAVLNGWAQEDCAKRYGFLYAEVIGASGRSLGKSNPKLTKKSASTLKSGWRKDRYGENEFLIEIYCSGSMKIPVEGPSNDYSVKAYYQLWNESNKFKTKVGISSDQSREYSVAELDSNNWRVELVAGQTSSNRCCSDNSWGPAPKLAKLPDLNFKLIETREFNEEDQYLYGPEGKSYIFEIVNAKSISNSFSDWYIELSPAESFHGQKDDEVYAALNLDLYQLTIFIPKTTRSGPGQYVKLKTGYQYTGFARWVYSLSNTYSFNLANPALSLKTKIESIRGYSLY